MYGITVKTDSGTEPVNEATIKNFIKYDESDATEIALILSLLKSARELIEKYLNVSLKSKTYQLSFDSVSIDEDSFRIPYGPVVSISAFTFTGYGSIATALVENTDYYVTGNQFKEIQLPYVNEDGYYVLEYISGYGGSGVETDYYVTGNQFKEIQLPYVNEDGYYVLEYISGYGGSGVETLPDVLKTAICKQVMIWYERGVGEPLDKEVIGMISPYAKQYFI